MLGRSHTGYSSAPPPLHWGLCNARGQPNLASPFSDAFAPERRTLIDTLLFVVLVFALVVLLTRARKPAPSSFRKRPGGQTPARPGKLTQPKPPWVRPELLRLKALMPAGSCRKLATTFNGLHEGKCGVMVGKSFVAETLRGRSE